MVALVISFAIALGGIAAIVVYGQRRPTDAPLSWGEAIAAATFAFALMFWAYGVVPHQWLTYAGNEQGWRPDKILVGPGSILEKGLPFTLSYETLSHLIVVGIYGFFLVLHVAMWVVWQNRGKQKPVEIERTAYGRPLVRQS